MLKKVLFLLNSEHEKESIEIFTQTFRSTYHVEIDGLYVKDILKYEAFPMTVEGLGVTLASTYTIPEFVELEEENCKKIVQQVQHCFDHIIENEGETVTCVFENLKGYDLLVILQNGRSVPQIKEMLRLHYKPLLLLKENIPYKFDKVLLLDDGEYKSNKTLFSYYNLFGEHYIEALRVNVNENNNVVLDRFGEHYFQLDKKGDPLKIIVEDAKKYDLILMGELKYIAMIDKLSKKLGGKLLELIDKPIFIG